MVKLKLITKLPKIKLAKVNPRKILKYCLLKFGVIIKLYITKNKLIKVKKFQISISFNKITLQNIKARSVNKRKNKFKTCKVVIKVRLKYKKKVAKALTPKSLKSSMMY